jgi:hypothetical protein
MCGISLFISCTQTQIFRQFHSVQVQYNQPISIQPPICSTQLSQFGSAQHFWFLEHQWIQLQAYIPQSPDSVLLHVFCIPPTNGVPHSIPGQAMGCWSVSFFVWIWKTLSPCWFISSSGSSTDSNTYSDSDLTDPVTTVSRKLVIYYGGQFALLIFPV